MRQEEMRKILEVGAALSSERDPDRLLDRILSCVMELARCDGGTLYLLDGAFLHFRLMRNHTLGVCSGGDGTAPDLPPVPLKRENVCALAMLEARTIRIDDVYHCGEYDFSGPVRYDAMTGYRTRSMLVVPMLGRGGERLGVLQLINAQDEQRAVCPFSEEMELILQSVAAQAAVTIQNTGYLREIQELFQSFVRVMSTAIDERSPYNANHSRRMAQCGRRFLDWLNARAEAAGDPPPFPPERAEELLMSVWLHDVGKVVTPLEVMDKAERLRPEQKAEICRRMEAIRLLARLDCAEGRMPAEERDEVIRSAQEVWEGIQAISAGGYVTDEQLAWLEGLRARTYTDGEGQSCPWLTGDEYAMLSVRKGTLSPEERRIMEEHASVTDRLLAQIRFSGGLSHVRAWAAAHHELLDGSGYPNGLRGAQIPEEVRIITILDIFDALVADDRPYKPGMPPERAVSILNDMARKEGKLDPELTRLFVESRCWENEK